MELALATRIPPAVWMAEDADIVATAATVLAERAGRPPLTEL